MSIAVLTQVYDEMRRLAIAGSVVAGGDFRLKKLVAPLEQAGAKAPVFAKVAEAVKALVEAKEQTTATALLELATLVNAILYTQGETGLAGTLEPIATTDLGAPTTQAGARVLKPLLEALTTTGSGRLEMIRDAYERGAFRDLRLVKPALDALDDPYGEVGDFVADKVLPLYGKAIFQELKTKLDLKGKGGHPRRLRLMHQLDSVAARETVKQALDSGSKEIKVVAIECLANQREDLTYLLEQAQAKAQEVRQAAYRALATIDDEAAISVLQKALTGADLDMAADSIRRGRSAKLLKYVIAEAERELAALPKTKDKKEISAKISRLQSLTQCLARREEKEPEDFLLKAFAQRDSLAKIKGDSQSGSDLNATIVSLLAQGTEKLQKTLAEAHSRVAPEEIGLCFFAARQALPPTQVFDVFAPYLTAKVDEKKKQRDPAWDRREAICAGIAGQYRYWLNRQDEGAALDPRWLDIAVDMKHLGLVRQLSRPGHAGAKAFLSETFTDVMEKAKSLDQCHEVLAAMIAADHPDATDAFISALEKFNDKANYYAYWFTRLVVDLPKSAIPKLEALVPKLNDRVADNMLGYIQQLREKKE